MKKILFLSLYVCASVHAYNSNVRIQDNPVDKAILEKVCRLDKQVGMSAETAEQTLIAAQAAAAAAVAATAAANTAAANALNASAAANSASANSAAAAAASSAASADAAAAAAAANAASANSANAAAASNSAAAASAAAAAAAGEASNLSASAVDAAEGAESAAMGSGAISALTAMQVVSVLDKVCDLEMEVADLQTTSMDTFNKVCVVDGKVDTLQTAVNNLGISVATLNFQNSQILADTASILVKVCSLVDNLLTTT